MWTHLFGESAANTGTSLAMILGAMALVALLEAALPLYAPSEWNRAHLVPNLVLTLITFATNVVFNTALVAALIGLESARLGLLRWSGVGSVVETVLVLLVLDFSFYLAHVAMHKLPSFWRFHAVHHADPTVDVTTTVRQHPIEGVIRYVFMAAFALAVGASPGAFAIYRAVSALNGLLEHANLRVPVWLDRPLSWLTTWPNVHKLHHSRVPRETDTNYGNVFSFWDRIFRTFTPPRPGARISYGLNGTDDPLRQTTLALLVDPFRGTTAPSKKIVEPASTAV